jgi:C4-dicarboxylate-specific signal transduction histidine kinase
MEKENALEILIVEDSPTQAEKLKYLLENHGYRVSVADNGNKALDLLKERKPFLVISDIMMPEMGGYELCSRMRADKKLKDIPVILLTSLTDPKDVIHGLASGANNFITKPYDENLLISRIRHLQANISLRENHDAEKGVRVFFSGEHYFITAEPLQILDLLLSTYENAYHQNRELIKTRNELRTLNEELDRKVTDRTAHLETEITERKKAENELKRKTEELREMTQQLWQTAKMASVGELAASIAHELNNPLATVSLRIESLLAQTPEDDTSHKTLKIVEQEVERMGNLIVNLLQFSRRTQQQISTLDVCDEIEKTLELIHYHLRKHNIQIVKEFSPDAPKIHADRQQLRQLFLNLFTNASDAMLKGGTLTIRVTKIPESDNIIIEIADTGTGIPPDILPRVTEPFFTTKPEGKGTGLGLAICRRIVREHNGEFEIMSDGIPGRGTTVRISLPVNGNRTHVE